jgi:hypothetical protein
MSLHRDVTAARRALPKGAAFEIADLILARSWADRYDIAMIVRLDHGASVDEDYEEVIAFQTDLSPLNRVFIWRNTRTVFVQPLVGRARQYDSVAAALESLLPAQNVTLSDISAPDWPVGES